MKKNIPVEKEHVLDLFLYTRWAHRHILEALQATPLQEGVRLMSHVAAAQEIWLGRIEARDVSHLELWPDDDLPVCTERLEASTQTWIERVQDRRAEALAREVRYTNSKGDAFTNTLREIVAHVVNHGTHHRAQVATLLRQDGAVPPSTDYIFYARSAQSTKR